MIQRMVISFVISFVMKQLEKFKGSIDWTLVQKDLDTRIRALVPGSWFDDEACAVVDAALASFKAVLGEGADLKKVLELLAGQEYSEAAQLLKDIVLGHLSQVHFASKVKESVLA